MVKSSFLRATGKPFKILIMARAPWPLQQLMIRRKAESLSGLPFEELWGITSDPVPAIRVPAVLSGGCKKF